MPTPNTFVSYNNAEVLFAALGQKFDELNGAYVFKGSIPFASLPEQAQMTEDKSGFVWNISDSFTTDSRFIEGSGRQVDAGANVAVADLSTYSAVTPVGNENPSTEGWYEVVDGKYVLSEDTEVDNEKTYYAKTVNVKYDIVGTFVNIGEIEAQVKAVQDMIDGEFDETANYAAGDIVIYNSSLYKLDTAYTAYTAVEPVGSENPSEEGWYEKDGNEYVPSTDTTVDSGKTYYEGHDWSDVTATEKTVVELIESAEPNPLTTEQVNALIALID